MHADHSIKRTRLSALWVAATLVAGTAQATLLDRDLNGDLMVDAFYDTELNITWLGNAGLSGNLNWPDAMAWGADSLSVGGHSDWRLPTSSQCSVPPCPVNEMGHLFQVEGITAAAPSGFQNLSPSYYWTGTEVDFSTGNAWAYHMADGNDSFGPKTVRSFPSLAVANGDVALVPEPETYALLLTGLAIVGAIVRRKARRR